jgi:glycosyltransferase involved in cell wall biosynthesis
MISILILTKNEEQDLSACLASITWCDDVHILDSFSTDDTVKIASDFNATITQRHFDGYSSQRNYGLNNIVYKYDWLLILDADERIPNHLPQVLYDAIKNSDESVAGFRLRRKDFLNGTWLKHSQISPFYIRLVRIGKASYHREVNEVMQVDGVVVDIDDYFDHYPFSKGYTHWLNKHNQYSTMEAQRWVEEQSGTLRFSIAKALFSKDFSEKRFHQKGLFYKLPGRPLIKWLYMVVVRRAFLDGRAGIIYATLQAIYEYFIVLKAKEMLVMQQQKNGSNA